MGERKDAQAGADVVTSDAGVGFGVRFSPQVVVTMLTILAMFYAAQPAVVAFVHAWWGSSYRAVEFVMDEWRPNADSPYIAGHVTGMDGPAPFHLPGAVVGGRRVVQEVPAVVFEPGARVPVWYSTEAPLFSYNGEWTNAVPVAALPTRPGWGRVALYGLLTLAIAIAGFVATVWVARRHSRAWGSA